MSQASGFLESFLPNRFQKNDWSVLMAGDQQFLRSLVGPQILLRSLKIAAVVGTILVGINHGDLIIKGDTEKIEWYKIALTYIVPYCVSTYSAIVSSVSKK